MSGSLGVALLAIWSLVWVAAAAGLVLDRLGRLPGGARKDPRLSRRTQIALLLSATANLLFQVNQLARWGRPVRLTIDALGILAAIATIAAVAAVLMAMNRVMDSRPKEALKEPPWPKIS